ncbi:hypothetical protein [Periweissella ghanensis]|uniref:Uncharacterized protein n=1 Tax=Periweissella ghanensis TaxID=467997 RepID=A0ABN8BSX8_9LACO|nr:hypothetical protein [Periweissella ghanensis]MCM0600369.1 hypothetical protein [Periweissella ghanensis]CAH0419319.1 hypothetical protein WGH24286_01767 [Periweissella ghanensis]
MAQKLQALQYVRPDFDALRLEYIDAVQKFKKAESVNIAQMTVQNLDNLNDSLISTYEILQTLATQNPADEVYINELAVWRLQLPLLKDLAYRFANSLVKSKFRNQLEIALPLAKFKLAENQLKTYSSDIDDLLLAEQAILNEYQGIVATATINMGGHILSLPAALQKLTTFSASEQTVIGDTVAAFLVNHQTKLINLFEQLIQNRNQQAFALGYASYSEFSMAAHNHFDYSLTEVLSLCDTILTTMPIKLTPTNWPQQSATPTAETITSSLKTLLAALDPATQRFYDYLIEHESLTFTNNIHCKVPSLATFVISKQLPEITINLDCLPTQTDVLLNQLGRAFQAFSIRGLKSGNLIFSFHDTQAALAKGFEFICWPWLHHLVGNDAPSYRKDMITQNIAALTYHANQIKFAANFYQSQTPSINELNTLWPNQLKQTPNLPTWLLDTTLICQPDAALDNLLSIIIGMQFWQPNAEQGDSEVMNKYLQFAKNSSQDSLLNLLKLCEIESPFASATLPSLLNTINDYAQHMVAADIQ